MIQDKTLRWLGDLLRGGLHQQEQRRPGPQPVKEHIKIRLSHSADNSLYAEKGTEKGKYINAKIEKIIIENIKISLKRRI